MQKRTVEIFCDLCGATIPEETLEDSYTKKRLVTSRKELECEIVHHHYIRRRGPKALPEHADVCTSCMKKYADAFREVYQSITKAIRTEATDKGSR
jgi:hypothetical protein